MARLRLGIAPNSRRLILMVYGGTERHSEAKDARTSYKKAEISNCPSGYCVTPVYLEAGRNREQIMALGYCPWSVSP